MLDCSHKVSYENSVRIPLCLPLELRKSSKCVRDSMTLQSCENTKLVFLQKKPLICSPSQAFLSHVPQQPHQEGLDTNSSTPTATTTDFEIFHKSFICYIMLMRGWVKTSVAVWNLFTFNSEFILCFLGIESISVFPKIIQYEKERNRNELNPFTKLILSVINNFIYFIISQFLFL